jgi:hypothetical protein
MKKAIFLIFCFIANNLFSQFLVENYNNLNNWNTTNANPNVHGTNGGLLRWNASYNGSTVTTQSVFNQNARIFRNLNGNLINQSNFTIELDFFINFFAPRNEAGIVVFSLTNNNSHFYGLGNGSHDPSNFATVIAARSCTQNEGISFILGSQNCGVSLKRDAPAVAATQGDPCAANTNNYFYNFPTRLALSNWYYIRFQKNGSSYRIQIFNDSSRENVVFERFFCDTTNFDSLNFVQQGNHPTAGGGSSLNPSNFTDPDRIRISIDNLRIWNTSVPINPLGQISIDATLDKICSGASSSLTANPAGMTYRWLTTPIQNSRSISVNQPGIYSVVVSSNGCSDTARISIAMDSINAIIVSSNDTACEGDSVVLSAQPAGMTYSWNTTPPQTSSSIVVREARNYSVTVTNSNGCTGIANKSIEFQNCCPQECFWTLNGNNNVTTSNFIGPKNNADFKIRTNNIERMTVEANGNIGIGTTSPSEQLHTSAGVRFEGLTKLDSPKRIVTQDNTGKLYWSDALALKGDQGEKGEKGDQGPTGPQGPQGPAGPSNANEGLTFENDFVKLGNRCGENGSEFQSNREILQNQNNLYFNSGREEEASNGKIYMGQERCKDLFTRLEIGTFGLQTPFAPINDYNTPAPSPSGLRFTNLTLRDQPIENRSEGRGVLSLDEDGDVIWVQDREGITSISNQLTFSKPNTITSNVNGVISSTNTVGSVANTSSGNQLSTTVNGITGGSVNIINSNQLSLNGSTLTSTVNGITSNSITLPSATGNFWNLNGNSNATSPPNVAVGTALPSTSNFIGTISNHPTVLATNNLERIRITADGNIGIGTNDNTILAWNGWNRNLVTNGQNNSRIISSTTTGNIRTGIYSHSNLGGWNGLNGAWGLIGTETNHNLAFIQNYSTRMVINNGNIGIGTTTPATQLHTTGTIRFTGITSGDNSFSRIMVQNNNGDVRWRDASSLASGNTTNSCGTLNRIPRLTGTNTYSCSQIFDNATTVGINKSTGFTYTWNGGLTGSSLPATSGTVRLDVDGVIRGTAIIATSDKTLKTNIENISNASQIVAKLIGKSYQWTTEFQKETGVDNGKHYGFLAQDLAEVLPNVVMKDENGRYGVEYQAIIPILVEAIKEQQTQIDALKSSKTSSLKIYTNEDSELLKKENETLKNKVNSLESKFDLLEKTLMNICESGCAGLDNITPKESQAKDMLYQSIPNPSDDEAMINYYLAKNYQDVYIQISDLNGKIIEKITLNPKHGNGSIKVSLGKFAAQSYIYFLIVEEKIVDSKKMTIIK